MSPDVAAMKPSSADDRLPTRAGRAGDQPLPTAGEGDILATLARDLPAALLERRRLGIERYGTPLQAFNGRSAIRDGREELLDAFAYFEQERVERERLEADLERAERLLDVANAERAELREKVAAFDAVLRSLETKGWGPGAPKCPVCRRPTGRNAHGWQGRHAADCALAAALGSATPLPEARTAAAPSRGGDAATRPGRPATSLLKTDPADAAEVVAAFFAERSR